MEKAKELLLESDRHVSEIAYEVGFRDANYFSRSFIREFGLNATKLRETFTGRSEFTVPAPGV